MDTSGLFALLNRWEHNRRAATVALRAEAKPYSVPAAILGELAYLVERELSPAGLDAFLVDIEAGQYTLDCGEQDLPRTRALRQRYDDLSLGFVDAAVIACAERNGGRVLTLDLRHFGVVAREGKLTIVP